MQNTVIGVYDNFSEAQAAFNALAASGFSRTNVKLSPEEDSQTSRTSVLRHSEEDEGWSIGKFFRSMFGSEEPESSYTDAYQEAVRRGGYLVTVDAGSEEQRDQATEILNRFNPVDIDERSSQWRTQGWSAYDRSANLLTEDEIKQERSLYAAPTSSPSESVATRGTSSRTGKGETRLSVVEEELQVGKRVVQRGGVRIVQRMSERPVEETVHLREENVHVERHPVSKEATQADLEAFKEGSMELRETAEEPVVSKTARVVEEVVVGKDVKERDEKVKGKVRRTDVDVEQLDEGGSRTMAAGFDSDRDYYRTHWKNSYASQGGRYEDYEPAYRFGSELRSNDSYRGRNWNEVEPELHREWESRNAGSPWEKTKDAARARGIRTSCEAVEFLDS